MAAGELAVRLVNHLVQAEPRGSTSMAELEALIRLAERARSGRRPRR